MAKKFKVVQVTIRVEASATKYLRESANKDDLANLLKGVKDLKNWSLKTDAKDQVIDAWPSVDKHPGHVQGKDYKMQIEKGKASVDRLFLKLRKYESAPAKNDPNLIQVKIAASAFVETDTH